MDTAAKTKNRLLVVDTDPGLDDAQAIFMLLADPEVEILAFTTVRGNSDIEQVTINLLRILTVAGRLDIPVYKGSTCSLLGDVVSGAYHHGEDGLGDTMPMENSIDVSLIKDTHAVVKLIQLVNEHPGEITLLCLAPLTNIALALRMDPDFGSKLKDCIVMGGNAEAKGNVTCTAEYNTYADPESSHIVLRDMGFPVTMVGWECCCHHEVTLGWFERLIDTGSAKAKFIQKIEHNVIERLRNANENYLFADQFVAAIALDKSVVKQYKLVHCLIELHGHLTRGQMVVDWDKITKKDANAKLVTNIDMDVFKSLLNAAF